MATLTLSDELGAPAPVPEPQTSLKSRLLEYERGLITRALEEAAGNQRRAARELGILPTTLHEKMKRLGLRAAAFLPAASRGQTASPDVAAAVAASEDPSAP